MHRWLAPNVIVPVSERLTGRRAWSEMRLLQSLQWRSAAELEARAFAKLGPLLTQAAAHVPYYRDLCSGSGVHPSDIRCLDDLAKVPVTTKDALRPTSPRASWPTTCRDPGSWSGSTSGSTGSPFRFYADADADTARHASYLFFLDWTGAALWDKRFVIAYQGYVPLDPMAVRLARRVLLGEQAILLSGVDLTAAALRSRVGRLRGRSRYFIQAYPSYAALLAASILEQGVDLGVYPIAVITMSETLTDLHADTISRAFRCRVVNHYSTWESFIWRRPVRTIPIAAREQREGHRAGGPGRWQPGRRRRGGASLPHRSRQLRHAVHQLRHRRPSGGGSALSLWPRVPHAAEYRGASRGDHPDARWQEHRPGRPHTEARAAYSWTGSGPFRRRRPHTMPSCSG